MAKVYNTEDRTFIECQQQNKAEYNERKDNDIKSWEDSINKAPVRSKSKLADFSRVLIKNNCFFE